MTDDMKAAARRRNRAIQRADAALALALRHAGLPYDKNTVDRITSSLLDHGHDVKAVRKGL